MNKFMPYAGDLMGLPTNENHLNFRWCKPGCKVLFSVTRHGNAVSCHLASDKCGMKKIEQAINEFCDFIFYTYEWCNMIMALTRVKKVRKIIRNCKFFWVKSFKKKALYIRRRNE